jgi:hypothetical protein
MPRRHLSRTRGDIFALWCGVAIIFGVLSSHVYAQLACSSGTATGRGTVGSDGRRHVNVMGTGNQTVDARLQESLNGWNAFTSTTNVELHLVTSGDFDLKFTMDDAQVVGGCASFNGTNRVYIETGYATSYWAQNMSSLTTTVFEHELGHYLGMRQDNNAADTSIMVGAQTGGDCPTIMNSIPTGARDISLADAQKAGECVSKGLGDDPGQIYEDYDENGQCWDVYMVTEYWYCEWDTQTLEGYCVHQYDDWNYQYTTCEPPY